MRNSAGVPFAVDAADAARSSLALYMNHAPSASAACNAVLVEQSAFVSNAAYATTLRLASDVDPAPSEGAPQTAAQMVVSMLAMQQAPVARLL